MKKGKPRPRKSGPTKAGRAARVEALERALTRERARRRNAEDALNASVGRQTATAQVLSAISGSPTDVQPVFDMIVHSARRLLNGFSAAALRIVGNELTLAALTSTSRAGDEAVRSLFPMPMRPSTTTASAGVPPAWWQMLSSGQPRIIVDTETDPNLTEEIREAIRARGYRSQISVPMLREGRAAGLLFVTRVEPGAFTEEEVELLKTFADQAVIAIENARLFTELETSNRDLTAALEQQTATAGILRVMSRSPANLQPVFDAIAESAQRLCRADLASAGVIDAGHIVMKADRGFPEALQRLYPRPVDTTSLVGSAAVERRVLHVPDIDDPSAPRGLRAPGSHRRHRSQLVVPMMRESEPIGVIVAARYEPGPFSDSEIELLQAFADQAVIAIENVRLFTELQEKNHALTGAHAQVSEALERQTATAEILRVISSSPADVQPVFDAIVKNALRLCAGDQSLLVGVDGGTMTFLAAENPRPEGVAALRAVLPRPLGRDTVTGRTILERRVVQIPDVTADAEYALQHTAALVQYRAVVGVPMLRDGVPIGALLVGRQAPGQFAERQIDILKTFADQAVIAIENVRLFTELQEKNRALTDAHAHVSEALEQQAATIDILRVISSSPTDVQPVFDTIAESAWTLCSATVVAVYRFDGELIHLVAHHGFGPQALAAAHRMWPSPPHRGNAAARSIADAVIVHIPDFIEDPEYRDRQYPGALHVRAVLSVPMLRECRPIGAVTVGRSDPGPYSDKQVQLLQTFADQAVIAIENVRLFTELQAKNTALTDALEQQTATSAILGIISSSPTDAQPVFDAVARSAVTLCDAFIAGVFRLEDDLVHLVAGQQKTQQRIASVGAVAEQVVAAYPAPLTSPLMPCRAIRENGVIHVPDVEAPGALPPEALRLARSAGLRSALVVPMGRDGGPIGSIFVARPTPGHFSDEQIALLQTFADQAVIAIENVRLFTELQEKNRALSEAHGQVSEALDHQTTTAEILRVISRSPTDVQPVLEAIAERGVRLCNALFGVVYRFDGELLHFAAQYNANPEALDLFRLMLPAPLSPHFAPARAILERRIVHVPDVDQYVSPVGQPLARAVGARSLMSVPMLKDGVPLGAITIARPEAGPFSDKHVELLKTFADQAVIAIENVRLFTELQQKNRALTDAHATGSEALEQQTATAEILRVISRSPTDTALVFDAIADSATRLTGAHFSVVFRFDGSHADVATIRPAGLPFEDEYRRTYPVPVRPGVLFATPLLEGRVRCTEDTETDPAWSETGRQRARLLGFRSNLWVPMLKDDKAVGMIAVARREPGRFSDKEIDLLRTFADQAVIAIENVRLFKELDARNRELTTALDHQTATADILRVISRSHTDVQPVFQTIVDSATRLLRGNSGVMSRIVDDRIELVAFTRTDAVGDALLASFFPIPLHPSRPDARPIREGVIGGRVPYNVADTETDPRVGERGRANARVRGYRSQLVVPVIRDDDVIGTIAVTRPEPGAFADDEIALLQTFADQAIIAIENARLLTELQARTAELTRSVDELTALGDVSRALSSTLDLETVLQTIVTRANQLAGTAGCTIWEYDEAREEFRLRVSHYADERDAVILGPDRVTTIPRGRGVTTRVVELRQPVQITDITVEGAYESPIRRALLDAGHRALLGVPLLREDQVIGVLAVTRKTPGEFAPGIVQLLSTFATQSSLAIQNARLFREIEDKSRELEIASQHKSDFLASMSHELRTPLNAIIGFSDVLLERMFGELNDKQTEYLQDILASGKHLLSLINDILDLSKIEAGRMERDLAEFDLPQAIEDALTLMRERASRRRITVECVVDERLGAVHADERKVKQVLLNLLSNAVKFTPEGGRIDVRAGLDGETAEIAVADTGVGIAPEDHDAVFEEFRQVGSTARKVEGTGLGLALCRKFVELHGGRIWVKSQVGRGSTFTFTLPVRH